MPSESVVAPLPDCSECNGTGMMALCGDITPGTPCVMRAGHDSPHWGEDDVASDWSPFLPCRACQSCPMCGSTLPESGTCAQHLAAPYTRSAPA